MKRIVLILTLAALSLSLLSACGKKQSDAVTSLDQLREPGRIIGVGTGTGDDAAALRWVLVNIVISAVVLLAVNLLERNEGKHPAAHAQNVASLRNAAESLASGGTGADDFLAVDFNRRSRLLQRNEHP